MIILIDNYDSFTFNLVQYLGELGSKTHVYRNDQISVQNVIEQKPSGIIISPGPSNPDNAGICLDLITKCAEQNIPLLGVCLGHQAIGQVFGGKVIRAPEPVHGKTSNILHKQESVFKNIPSPFEATRYHSLIVERDSLPDTLQITAQSEDGLIMGLQHKSKPIHGVQFHPESIATKHGHDLLQNFLNMV